MLNIINSLIFIIAFEQPLLKRRQSKFVDSSFMAVQTSLLKQSPESHTQCWLLVTIYNRNVSPPAPDPAPHPPQISLEKSYVTKLNF